MNELFNLKLLYVEDEQETRNEMVKFLKRRFAKITTAESGADGLRKFHEIMPDIIIADLLMEGMGGIEMIEKIRNAGSDSAVIITSALSDTESILKTVALGIDNYIIKPVNTAELSSTLEKIAEKILKQQTHNLRFDVRKKKELENQLRIEVSAYIKKKTGKGPQKINIFIGNEHIELSIGGFLTLFDESLLVDRRNSAIVEHSRRLFYKTVKIEFERLIGTIIGYDAELGDIIIDSEQNRERCVFKY